MCNIYHSENKMPPYEVIVWKIEGDDNHFFAERIVRIEKDKQIEDCSFYEKNTLQISETLEKGVYYLSNRSNYVLYKMDENKSFYWMFIPEIPNA